MKLFVGIDVSSKKLDVCFLDSEDTRLKEETFPNDLIGANKIKENILTYNQQFHYENIVIGMESTSVFSFHPATMLDQDKNLKRIGAEVVVQNPKAIHRFDSKAYLKKTKPTESMPFALPISFDSDVQ